MPDKIKILELEIVNYRQYYDKQVMRFLDRDEGFSVILGEMVLENQIFLTQLIGAFTKKNLIIKKTKANTL